VGFVPFVLGSAGAFHQDLLNILDAVAKAGAGFRSLADAWADTTRLHGRLMLTVLGGLAEFERELIRARTGEGRVKFGRPPKLNAHQRKEAIARMRNGETQADIARTYEVAATTIGRLDCSSARHSPTMTLGDMRELWRAATNRVMPQRPAVTSL
jgi:DNA invertase Pin-like site-specific DNA recombinase